MHIARLRIITAIRVTRFSRFGVIGFISVVNLKPPTKKNLKRAGN